MKEGLATNEVANIAVDKRKNKDLQSLTSVGGPFTSVTQVDEYMKSNIDSNTKTDILLGDPVR